MIRTSILAGAAALASLVAWGAGAQPADPNYKAQQQDYQAKQQQYQAQQQQYQNQVQTYDQKQADHAQAQGAYDAQRAGYRESQATYAEQRRFYLLGRAAYEAKYGPGSYDVYTRSHSTTTTVVNPAGDVESRTKTTVIETPKP
jgi:hypothetical protein